MPRIKTLIDPATACRRCAIRCDKIVYPSGCVESSCPRLYAYEEHGRTFVGCLDRIIGVELDLEAFRAMQRTREGFGGLRATREPHDFCRTDVDAAFEHRGEGICHNPAFLTGAIRHPLRAVSGDDAG